MTPAIIALLFVLGAAVALLILYAKDNDRKADRIMELEAEVRYWVDETVQWKGKCHRAERRQRRTIDTLPEYAPTRIELYRN